MAARVHLYGFGGSCRNRRRATDADDRVLLARCVLAGALRRSALVLIIGGTGYLYGGLIGAVIYKFLQDWIANLTPQYWQFWIGLVLVVIVLIGRERMSGWIGSVRALLARLTTRFFPRSLALRSASPEGH